MIISPKEFKLKDGRIAQIRNPEEKDAQGMLDYLSLSTEETEFLLRYLRNAAAIPLRRKHSFLIR